MNPKNIAIAAVSIAIIGVFFLFFTGGQNQTAPTIKITENKDKYSVREQITISATASDEKQVNRIILKTPAWQEEFFCGQKECIADFKLSFETAGAHQIEVIAENSGAKTASQKTILLVFDSKITCIDLTPDNECSSKKPFLCQNQKLVENCAQCGCQQGTLCTLNNCTPISMPLRIENALPLPARIVRAENGFGIKVSLKNSDNEIVAKGAQYDININLSGPKKTEKAFAFTLSKDLENASTEEPEFRVDGLKEGNYAVEIIISAQGQAFDTFRGENFVQASTDTVPPDAPTGLISRLSGDRIEVLWSPNTETDLAGYKIYKSSSIQATHIKYSLHKTVEAGTTKTAIDGLENGTYYFVVKAFDFLSNESRFSQTTRIEKR